VKDEQTGETIKHKKGYWPGFVLALYEQVRLDGIWFFLKQQQKCFSLLSLKQITSTVGSLEMKSYYGLAFLYFCTMYEIIIRQDFESAIVKVLVKLKVNSIVNQHSLTT
jgi:hypothetical protein